MGRPQVAFGILCLPKISVGRIRARKRIGASYNVMLALLHLIGILVVNFFKSRSRLEAENLFVRHQLNIAMRRAPPRLRLCGYHRAVGVHDTGMARPA
jgi:hypothetical protein